MASQDAEQGEVPRQAGAVPYRRMDHGVEFCLITSTEGRWIFPKGTVKAGKNYWKTAIREAVEEAGLRGNLLCQPLGSYEMVKDEKIYSLVLFLMEVTRCEQLWEEADFRRRRWATRDEARRLLCQPLRDCLDVAVARINGCD
jgi:8-oxo-dGTP pyrophosphatase MutT (NUDIX family)